MEQNLITGQYKAKRMKVTELKINVKKHDSFNFHRRLKLLTTFGGNAHLTSLHNNGGAFVSKTYMLQTFSRQQRKNFNFTLEEVGTGTKTMDIA